MAKISKQTAPGITSKQRKKMLEKSGEGIKKDKIDKNFLRTYRKSQK